VLRPEPRKEWRQLADYWKGGGRQPILFLREASRPNLRLLSRRSQTTLNTYTWPPVVERFLDGALPSRIELIRIDRPSWFADSGFFLSEEAGYMDDVARESHRLFVTGGPVPRGVLLSGRVKAPSAVPVTLRVGQRTVEQWMLAGEFTVDAEIDPSPGEGYVPITLEAPAPVIFTAFQLQEADLGTIHPTSGFHHAERDERAALYRWMGPDAEAVIEARHAARLRLRLRVPIEHYALPVTLTLGLDGRPLATIPIASKDVLVEQPLPFDASGRSRTLTLKVSHHFVPNDVEHNGDTRRLSLRVYELALEALQTPGT
jgi:hypothetical protein